MKQELESEFPQEIKSVFYQKKSGPSSENQIHLYIEFKKPLAQNITLEKVYFSNQSAIIDETTQTTFEAHFKEINTTTDIILDADAEKEYGNKAPVLKKTNFDLKRDEAVLEYKNNDKTQYFKITNLTEKKFTSN
ncbi:hypothetical protein SAMN05444372_11479 [Flavobacterium micromati]|uniref:Uncharacterized protein n=2 Tax=Flavobacterium micromati TaxID=229205 RepID=A0A1M5Q485_9FLAO|nr:hypothetical protein SAMN05444372_11479 [Flavobacterium micromati]